MFSNWMMLRSFRLLSASPTPLGMIFSTICYSSISWKGIGIAGTSKSRPLWIAVSKRLCLWTPFGYINIGPGSIREDWRWVLSRFVQRSPLLRRGWSLHSTLSPINVVETIIFCCIYTVSINGDGTVLVRWIDQHTCGYTVIYKKSMLLVVNASPSKHSWSFISCYPPPFHPEMRYLETMEKTQKP